MKTLTYDEMRQLEGGDYACIIAAGGWAAAEAGLIYAIPTGGWSLFIAGAGMAAALYGMMNSCA